MSGAMSGLLNLIVRKKLRTVWIIQHPALSGIGRAAAVAAIAGTGSRASPHFPLIFIVNCMTIDALSIVSQYDTT